MPFPQALCEARDETLTASDRLISKSTPCVARYPSIEAVSTCGGYSYRGKWTAFSLLALSCASMTLRLRSGADIARRSPNRFDTKPVLTSAPLA